MSMRDNDLRALVRRVVTRVAAERGREPHLREHAAAARARGVHVVVGAGERPATAADDAPRSATGSRGRGLVDVETLAAIPPGGTLRVPAGALVTALAEEEARRRGIRLARTGAGLVAGRVVGHGAGYGVGPGRASALAIAVGCDHGGFQLKGAVLEWLGELGHRGVDLGTHDENAVDYPDFARAVAEAVAAQRVDFGICIDGAGIGSAMAANKVPGVRAANCWSAKTAANAREHNYANVLTLGSGVLDAATAREVVRTFLSTPEGALRHARRVQKITAIERRYARGSGPCACGGPCGCGETCGGCAEGTA